MEAPLIGKLIGEHFRVKPIGIGMFQFSRVLRHSLPASFFGAKPNAHKCTSRSPERGGERLGTRLGLAGYVPLSFWCLANPKPGRTSLCPSGHHCTVIFFARNSHRDTFKCATTPTTPPPNPPPGLDLPPTPIGEHLLGTWELVCRLSLVECTCSVWPPSLLVTCLLQVMVLGVVLQA